MLAPPTGPLERLPDEWAALLAEAGEPSYRAAQIFKWIHGRGVVDPERMTNLPKRLRSWLGSDGLTAALELAARHRSEDGTQKLLLEMIGAAELTRM